jgi:hypothetical protein
MNTNAHKALRGLLDALVSPHCPDAHLPALFAGIPGGGDIALAIIAARRALTAEDPTYRFIQKRDADGCPYLERD